MLEKITYTNHLNESIDFGANGVFVNQNDLHDYMWSYEIDNNKISIFNRGYVTKHIPLVVVDSKASTINKIMECAEKDVLSKMPGKIICNDYYMQCYIVGSTKKNYILHPGYMNIELIVATDSPAWVKETSKTFSKQGGGSGQGKNLDFPYGQPFDFAIGGNITEINNIGFMPCDFRMVIYGPIVNPSIYIGSHNYELLNCSIIQGEYLTIDSKNKTIILTQKNGTKVNKFSCRNKDSYIFEKIPSGISSVTWADDFRFDVVLFEERSEPKWI